MWRIYYIKTISWEHSALCLLASAKSWEVLHGLLAPSSVAEAAEPNIIN